MFTASTLLASLALASTAYGHAVVTAVQGANGVGGQGFGLIAGTPRNCTDEQPCQLDTSVMKNLVDDPCGATLAGGSIDIDSSLSNAIAQGGGQLPSIESDGSISVLMHQVNADGGGPFTAQINTDGTGENWEDAEVTVQPAGVNSIIRNGPNVDAQLTANVGSGTQCTGGENGNACLIRLSNGGPNSFATGAGPFGGCFAVQSGDDNNNDKRSIKRGLTRKSFLQKRAALTNYVLERAKREIIKRTLALDAGDIEDLKTTLGTAIDIPIDMLAGHNDMDPLGGNSTGAGIFDDNATLTFQQSTDLKKAVQDAIAGGLNTLADQDGTQVDNGVDPAVAAQANADARAAIEEGVTTTVNAGNAGVGFFNSETVANLLGGIAENAASTPSAVITQPQGVLVAQSIGATQAVASASAPVDNGASAVAGSSAGQVSAAASTAAASDNEDDGDNNNEEAEEDDSNNSNEDADEDDSNNSDEDADEDDENGFNALFRGRSGGSDSGFGQKRSKLRRAREIR